MLMIFSDQDVMVISEQGDMRMAGVWSDELDDFARENHALVVVINSDPAVIYADYRRYFVSDSESDMCKVFDTEAEAADFIGTLPGHETGRYNLDGPADDW